MLPDTVTDVIGKNKEMAIDPFTGTALVYKKEAGGYAVYSVGQDRQDQGGTFSPAFTPWQWRGKVPPIDIGVRVQRLGPASSRLTQP